MFGRVLILATLSLSACVGTPREVWLKPGAPADAQRAALAACVQSAEDRVPERKRMRVRPYVGPYGPRCIGRDCRDRDPFPDMVVYDANVGLRNRAVGACMGARGFSPGILRTCTGPVRVLGRQPADLTGLCVMRDGRIARQV